MSEAALPARQRKLIIHALTGDFRSSTALVEDEVRAPGPGEVLIRNRIAGCNAIFDQNLCRNGVRYVDVKPPFDLGVESVGEIAALGPGVGGFTIGEPVSTTKLGSAYREYQVAEIERVIKVAAATPQILTLIPTGLSALVGLERVGELRGGETVIISAAAGGLGHMAVQIAKLAGCHVVALTGSAHKTALLESLGADRVIDHRALDLRAVLAREYPRGFDIAYDTVGGEIFDIFLDNLAVRGRLVISGHTSDFDREIEHVAQPRIYHKLYWKSASVRGFMNPEWREYFAEGAQRMLRLYAEGKLRVLVDPTRFDGLGSAADAVEYLMSGRSAGKVVIYIP
jgi:hypothetical protein